MREALSLSSHLLPGLQHTATVECRNSGRGTGRCRSNRRRFLPDPRRRSEPRLGRCCCCSGLLPGGRSWRTRVGSRDTWLRLELRWHWRHPCAGEKNGEATRLSREVEEGVGE